MNKDEEIKRLNNQLESWKHAFEGAVNARDIIMEDRDIWKRKYTDLVKEIMFIAKHNQ